MKRNVARMGLALTAALALGACGDDDGTADVGLPDVGTADAGPTDSGTDSGPVDICPEGCLVAGVCYPDSVQDPANACQSCDTAVATDAFSPNDGSLCDDGAFCTSNDTCSAGVCEGTARDCDDGIECNGVATCDEETDACVGADPTCADGEICNAVTNMCVAECGGCLIEAICYGDGQVNALNPCAVCDVETARDAWSDNDGGACDDGSFCTTGDVCLAGACAGPDALNCSDGIDCNGAETCDDDADACLPSDSICGDDEICDADSNMCISTCPGCLIDGVCYGDGQVNAAETCLECDAAEASDAWSNREGSCDDGLYCTDGDSCSAGACVAGAARACGDAVDCNGAESCDEDANSCVPGDSTCGAGTMCDTDADMCVVSCGGDTMLCDDSCVNTDNDPAHCGGCDNACGVGEACVSGGCAALASGCSTLAEWSYEIAPDLWFCAFNNLTDKTWPQTYGACNEDGGFYLATVGPMTRRGLPTDPEIAAAMAAARANSHDYVTSGHPARGCDWTGSDYENCNGLGYVRTTENTGAGTNWQALTDGNEAGLRSWPSANDTGAHRLASICMNASGDPASEVFDHRWRSAD